jgi:hypothetical protein
MTSPQSRASRYASVIDAAVVIDEPVVRDLPARFVAFFFARLAGFFFAAFFAFFFAAICASPPVKVLDAGIAIQVLPDIKTKSRWD